MLETLSSFLKPEILVTVLIALAAFAAVLSIAAPLMQSDPLQSRMKSVTAERNKLRAQQRARLQQEEGNLRRGKDGGTAKQLVDVLHLRKIFEAESSRNLLRQAGLRNERHVFLYLAARCLVPIICGVLAYLYMSIVYARTMPVQTHIAAAAVGLIIGNYLPFLYVRNLVSRRQASIRRAWPDSLDLMLICVESGMAIEPAMQRVAREIGSISIPLAEEMTLTVAELSYLQDRRKALENLSKRTGMPQVKSVVTSLIQSERYGTPLGTALRVLAQENRDMRMAEAERKAAALPPRLTVPMMLFFMPVIFVVIMAPSVMRAMKLL